MHENLRTEVGPTYRFRGHLRPSVVSAWLVAIWMSAFIVSAVIAAEATIRSSSSTPGASTRGVRGIDPGAKASPPPLVERPEAAAEGAKPSVKKFQVSKIRFDGNSVISTAELEALARPYEGVLTTLSELRQLTKKIRDIYQSRGYILARAGIPKQKLKQGVVLIVISEGRFGKVKVEGNRFYTSRFIQKFFGPALKGGLVREGPVHRSLLLLNEFSDLTVKTLFQAGEQPGTSDVVLKIKDARPLHVSLEYNDYGNRYVGWHRAGIGFWGGNVFTDGDEFFARIMWPFPSKSDPFGQATYTVPVGHKGNKVGFSYANSAITLGSDLTILDSRGMAEIFGLTFQHPLVRKITDTINLTAGLVGKTVQNYFFGNTLVSQDDLRLLTLGCDGSILRGKGRTIFSVSGTQGLGTLFGGVMSGATFADGTSRNSRMGAGNELTKGNTEVFHIRSLAKGKFLLLHGTAQVASQPLPVSEQLGLGGPDSVRGYIQSEFLGDEGYTLSAEYRQGVYDSKNAHVQLVGFFDHGYASLMKPMVGEKGHRKMEGVGVGSRASLGRHLNLRLDLGFPLEGDNIHAVNPVIYGQMTSRW